MDVLDEKKIHDAIVEPMLRYLMESVLPALQLAMHTELSAASKNLEITIQEAVTGLGEVADKLLVDTNNAIANLDGWTVDVDIPATKITFRLNAPAEYKEYRAKEKG